jgi:hypothetical protein
VLILIISKRTLQFRSPPNVNMEIAFLKMLAEWGAPMNTKTSYVHIGPEGQQFECLLFNLNSRY